MVIIIVVAFIVVYVIIIKAHSLLAKIANETDDDHDLTLMIQFGLSVSKQETKPSIASKSDYYLKHFDLMRANNYETVLV